MASPFVATPLDAVSPTKQKLRLSWDNFRYNVKATVDTESGPQVQMKPLLKGITGCALPARLLAVMGPSGAGKTTFLNAIAGKLVQNETHVLEGCGFLNNAVLSNHHKRLISFVAQDDIVMGKETPREALNFSYRMRTNASAEDAEARTTHMLRKLHLKDCADTLLGVPGLIKGVSGGEKKRTNIGNELIHNPRILLLDEPTTGLDSVNAERVGQLLQDLAHVDGRTVMCTIHTPSSELFALFDDVLLLAKGRVAYHGPVSEAPAYFAKIGHAVPPRFNPSEWYMDVLQLEEKALTAVLDAWDAHCASPDSSENQSIQRVEAPEEEPSAAAEHSSDALTPAGWGLQLQLLTARSMRLYRRDPASTIGRAVQTLFFAILLGLFYFKLSNDGNGVQDRMGCIFMIAVNSIMISAMSGVASFPPERAVFLMEQSSEMYSPWIYFLAKTIAETPFQIAFPTVYSCVLYFMVGMHESPGGFFVFLLIVILVSNCGYSFGLFAASFFPSPEVAMAFVPMMMLPMFLVGGLFANTARLDPGFLWLNYISFIRYGFIALSVNEFDRVGNLCSGASCRFTTGKEVLVYYGFGKEQWEINVMAVILIIFGLRVLAATALWYQGNARRGSFNFRLPKVAVRSLPYN